MTWKLFLPALLACAALAACGGDDCTRASDQLATCAMSSSSSSGMMDACAGAALCRAQCVNQFTCTQINSNTPAYAECLALCKGK